MGLHYKGFPLAIEVDTLAVNFGPMQTVLSWTMTRPGANGATYQIDDGVEYLALEHGTHVLDLEAMERGIPLRARLEDLSEHWADAWWNMSHDVHKDLPPMPTASEP